MNKNIREIYRFMLGITDHEMQFMFALTDPDLVLFVEKYFNSDIKNRISGLVSRSRLLQVYYRDTVYLEKLHNRKYSKGVFGRVK